MLVYVAGTIPVNVEGEAWDDSALIEAYERAVGSFGFSGTSKVPSESSLEVKGKQLPPPTSAQGVVPTEASAPSQPHLPEKSPSRGKKRAQSDSTGSKQAMKYEECPNSIEHQVSESAGQRATTNPVLDMPPPPPPSLVCQRGCQDDFKELLLAWYQAGYQAGRYVATHHHDNNN